MHRKDSTLETSPQSTMPLPILPGSNSSSEPASRRIGITLEEFYQVVGELEIVRRKQNQEIQGLYQQINEMQAQIEKLREENGRLVKADNHE